jgi:5'-3' exonuclease
MGIPSYFSYIIKNHSNIISTLFFHKNISKTAFSSLYMDCNSIIYDSFHKLEKQDTYSSMTVPEIEKAIIDMVILGIKKYISYVNPSEYLFIAFDGVAPFAKMEQQRTRRYKSSYLSSISYSTDPNKQGLLNATSPKWNTAVITPGTDFMNTLSNTIYCEFSKNEKIYGVRHIIVSGSNKPGEGEHKIYEHLRMTSNKEHTISIYGLDSDLIMLSIFHSIYCKNIYIFREAPSFGDFSINTKSMDSKKHNNDSDLPLFLNIDKLMRSVFIEMDVGTNYDRYRVFDYVFICFFLGNDFLPHFPALNIRMHGIQVLLDTYRKCFANLHQNKYLILNHAKKIFWRNVHFFIKELAKIEHTLILQEYTLRKKWDHKYWPENTEKEKIELVNNIPVIFKTEENYICPTELYWEDRYYATLFENDKDKSDIKSICVNYLEGLEWVYKYYSQGCPNWRWKYNYHYPPLLTDLILSVPQYDKDFIINNNLQAFPEIVQLSYVLPPSQFYLLPVHIRTFLLEKYNNYYTHSMTFQWAFCRYFWESHNTNKPLDLNILEELESKL